MLTYNIALNSRQYSELERILRANQDLTRRLTEDKEMDGYKLFGAIVFELEELIEDGCGIDDFGIPILKTITAEIFPEDQEYFIRQIGKPFHCDNNINLKIELKS